jgi:Family of unknown function (DUF5908)
MPVQINEMVIRANIVEPHESASESNAKSPKSEAGKVDIVKECVEKVLEIINQKYQR